MAYTQQYMKITENSEGRVQCVIGGSPAVQIYGCINKKMFQGFIKKETLTGNLKVRRSVYITNKNWDLVLQERSLLLLILLRKTEPQISLQSESKVCAVINSIQVSSDLLQLVGQSCRQEGPPDAACVAADLTEEQGSKDNGSTLLRSLLVRRKI